MNESVINILSEYTNYVKNDFENMVLWFSTIMFKMEEKRSNVFVGKMLVKPKEYLTNDNNKKIIELLIKELHLAGVRTI